MDLLKLYTLHYRLSHDEVVITALKYISATEQELSFVTNQRPQNKTLSVSFANYRVMRTNTECVLLNYVLTVYLQLLHYYSRFDFK